MENTWYPAEKAEEFNPLMYQFVWNEDYTQFQAIPLRWWDDRSYADYQGDRFDNEMTEQEEEDMNQRANQDLVSVDHPKWQIVLVEPIYNWQGDRCATAWHRLDRHVYYIKAYALRKASQLSKLMEQEHPDLDDEGCWYTVKEVPKCATQAAKFEDSDLPF